jgi:hypothetical protein
VYLIRFIVLTVLTVVLVVWVKTVSGVVYRGVVELVVVLV